MDALPGLPERYEILGELGRGGGGAVLRARDLRLRRTVALKVLRAELVSDREAAARFDEEARVGARLQHAGLVPVYDHGVLADGRPWFTMREIRGRPFGPQIAEVHAAAGGADAPGLRRLVEVFAKVCDAVAYAHEQGVLHRDLKPANVVVSDHGDVLVVDWGLAKVVEAAPDDAFDDTAAPALTRAGRISGTPAYMSPEQARGDAAAVDRRSDVWALGAVLYEVLTGLPPYEGRDVRSILRQVLAGPPPDPRDLGAAPITVSLSAVTVSLDPEPPRRPLPDALVAVWERAMRPEPDERFPDAGAVAGAVHAWLDGSAARDRALARLAAADDLRDRAAGHRAEATRLRAEAQRLLDLPADAPEAARLPGWEAQRAAEREDAGAEDCALDAAELARSALELAPDLDRVHGRVLADLTEEHRAASAAGDLRACRRIVRAATRHLARAPEAARDAWVAATRREARLTLRSDPPGAEVWLHTFDDFHGRLRPRFERVLGTTPLEGVPVPAVSALCELHLPGRRAVRYPIAPLPDGEWRPVRPHEREPAVVPIPAQLGPPEGVEAEVFVPGGAVGGSWVPDLVVRVFPVTRGEWAAWMAAGGPRPEVEIAGPADRRPVSGVSIAEAEAFAAWRAAETGLKWRLPLRAEWRRFAGGVDGRRYPWGSRFDHAWARVRPAGSTVPAEVVDVDCDPDDPDDSVFGVRGCGGNVAEWTPAGLAVRGVVVPHARAVGPIEDVVSGGSVYAEPVYAEVDQSWKSDGFPDASVGFRLVRTA